MILGMTAYTFFHVLLSLIGIVAGLVVLYGLLRSERMNLWTLVFLTAAAATSLTGFGFPFHGFTPALDLGILSLIVLTPVILGRYVFGLAGFWRLAYVVGAVIALYFNVFVLVVQAFAKIGALHALAPTGSEPPFAVAQIAVLIFFIAAGFLSARRFHPAAV
jgi:hypothetical protein